MGVAGQGLCPKSIHGTVKNQNQSSLICSTWNIRRGLIVRDLELKEMLKNENIDVIFLTETDTKAIQKEEGYLIQGYKTLFQERKTDQSKLRIVCLVKNSLVQNMKIRKDLMSSEFPSIWIEVSTKQNKQCLIAGFYRQWTHENLTKEEAQQNGIEILMEQFESASIEKKEMIIMGDANLCSAKWKDPKFKNKKIANQLIGCL